jgi:hypothetical protein
MSNVIGMAVEALEEAKATLRERCPFGDAEATVDAALAELRRYEVVEGYTSHSDLQEWPQMVLAIGPTPSDARWRPAILLAEKEQP